MTNLLEAFPLADYSAYLETNAAFWNERQTAVWYFPFNIMQGHYIGLFLHKIRGEVRAIVTDSFGRESFEGGTKSMLVKIFLVYLSRHSPINLPSDLRVTFLEGMRQKAHWECGL